MKINSWNCLDSFSPCPFGLRYAANKFRRFRFVFLQSAISMSREQTVIIISRVPAFIFCGTLSGRRNKDNRLFYRLCNSFSCKLHFCSLANLCGCAMVVIIIAKQPRSFVTQSCVLRYLSRFGKLLEIRCRAKKCFIMFHVILTPQVNKPQLRQQ